MTTRRDIATTMRKRRGVVTMTLALVVAAGAAVAVSAAEDTPGVCNRNNAEAASDQFVVESGKAIREHIPRLGLAPELDAMAGPVTVVVFEGPHHAVPIFPALVAGNNAEAPAFNNVVCVVAPSGEESYYYDIVLEGIDLDGLAVDHRGK